MTPTPFCIADMLNQISNKCCFVLSDPALPDNPLIYARYQNASPTQSVLLLDIEQVVTFAIANIIRY